MPTITYEGPEDQNDPTTVLEIPHHKDGEPNVRLPLGEEVEVDDKIAKAAKAVQGHKVTSGSSGGNSNAGGSGS